MADGKLDPALTEQIIATLEALGINIPQRPSEPEPGTTIPPPGQFFLLQLSSSFFTHAQVATPIRRFPTPSPSQTPSRPQPSPTPAPTPTYIRVSNPGPAGRDWYYITKGRCVGVLQGW